MKLARSVLQSIRLKGRLIPYRLRESDTARRCRVRVSPAGVEVIVPRGSDDARAAAFLRENTSWILDQLAFLDRLQSVRRASARLSRNSILLRGRDVPVEIVPESTQRTYAITRHDGLTIRIHIPEQGFVDSGRALESWLRRQARREIAVRLAERVKDMRLRPARFYIRGQRTKWGGCSRRRNLSFNWRLIMAPPAVLDYVVVHELAHLIEPYHSTKFWLIVRSYCPQYARHKGWLRDNEQRLGM
jgi:predicted metal-dependent hydrolase